MVNNYKEFCKILNLAQAVEEPANLTHQAVNSKNGCLNYHNGQPIRKPVDGTIVDVADDFTDAWLAQEVALPTISVNSFNGIWSEVVATLEPKRLINPGVDNYIIIHNGKLTRFSLDGQELETKSLFVNDGKLELVDQQNNVNVYEIQVAEHSGGFRLDCIKGCNKGHIVSFRPWIDHMFTVTGSFDDGSDFGVMFAGFLNGTVTWRTEDETLGAIAHYEFTESELSFTFVHEKGGAPRKALKITGNVVKVSDGILWKANGVTLKFTRNFDGVWRCPGFNTFCLSSMGNVKTFQNYEKKTRTPVIFVCDYEQSTIIERYLDYRRLTYAAYFYRTSQIMDGLDGIDLGRRFENLYYFDGLWKFVENGEECELLILGKQCNLKKGGSNLQGGFNYYEGLCTITIGPERLQFVVDIMGLNLFGLKPLQDTNLLVELNRSEPF